MNRWVYLGLGWALVGLAAAGVVLPLLPTTPFLLLAGSCFLKSSPRWKAWLERSRVFGPFLKDWAEHRAVRRPVKVLAVVVVTGVVALTLARDLHWAVKAVVAAVASVGLFVVWRLPVVERQTDQET
jgi:uncharacterized membrane protein YbaN (DUF454 family)